KVRLPAAALRAAPERAPARARLDRLHPPEPRLRRQPEPRLRAPAQRRTLTLPELLVRPAPPARPGRLALRRFRRPAPQAPTGPPAPRVRPALRDQLRTRRLRQMLRE